MKKSFLIRTLYLLSTFIGMLAHAGKPNVVLIMADDLGWETISSYGAEDYKTPNIDRLAADGIRFEHCYSTPICTPSRVMIMTGKYNFRNYTHFGYLNPKEKTFAQLMQQAGYKTAIAGKWQLNGLYDKKTFADHRDNSRPHQLGFDEYCLWQLTTPVNKKGPNMTERFWSSPLEHNGKLLTVAENAGKYGPDMMSDFVCDFIQRHKDQPFFVYYPTLLPHDPFVPTPDTIGDAPRTQTTNLEPKSDEAKKRNFVAMVEYLDKIVGKIVKQLDEVGQLENTLILFTADNGTSPKIHSKWNGREIQGGKGAMKDNGTHVPLVAYWKGKSMQGELCSDLVDFTDVYPTLAELAGVPLNDTDPHDGQSFLPQILGKPTTPRRYALCHYQPYWGASKNAGAFVRTDRFKLYADGRFYDISKDLDEKNNLAGAIRGDMAITIHQHLQKLIQQLPPVPKGGKKSTERPTHPNWPILKTTQNQ
ncbi:sulfatase-like hydrolase/transferase [Rubritalea spongiae]|uniref:Sulfatase-like hydrolase/transferase n=1 Tax=Rubritalea spongiae TaxID=430797 RepID=A0ABW5E4D7_9BACT